MRKIHVAAALLALGSVAALPACSMNSGQYGGGGAPAMAARPPPVSSGMVKQVQSALQQQGMYRGNVDGVWGPETQNAVANYQQAHGLPSTGELNSPTLASLNLAADGTTSAMTPAPMATAPAPMVAAPPSTTPPAPVASTTTQ